KKNAPARPEERGTEPAVRCSMSKRLFIVGLVLIGCGADTIDGTVAPTTGDGFQIIPLADGEGPPASHDQGGVIPYSIGVVPRGLYAGYTYWEMYHPASFQISYVYNGVPGDGSGITFASPYQTNLRVRNYCTPNVWNTTYVYFGQHGFVGFWT